MIICALEGKNLFKKQKKKKEFEVDDIGPLEEYVGYKIDYDAQQNHLKLAKPVLIQSLEDEFQIDSGGHIPQTPAAPGQILGPSNRRNRAYTRRTNNVSVRSA